MAEERLTAEERAEITAWKFRAASLEKTLCSERDALYRAEARLAELAAAGKQMLAAYTAWAGYDGDDGTIEYSTQEAVTEAIDRLNAAMAAAEGQPAPPTEGG